MECPNCQLGTTGIAYKVEGTLHDLPSDMLETASSNRLNTVFALGLVSHLGSNISSVTERSSGTSYPVDIPALDISIPRAHTSIAYGEVE